MKVAWLPAKIIQNTRCSCSARPPTAAVLSTQRVPFSISSRCLSTHTEPSPSIRAASQIKFPTENGNGETLYDLVNARLVPISPSYFSVTAQFFDKLLALRSLASKYTPLPIVEQGKARRIVWKTAIDFQNEVGEAVRPSKYAKLVRVLDRLNQIHPAVMPAEVKRAMAKFVREIDPTANITKPLVVDKFGRALGVGRRKASTARAWVVEGNGEVLINGKTLAEAFGRIHDRESAIWALKSTDRIDKYNVWALVEGGGTTGQAEAITLAVAKALIAHEPLLKAALRRAGCVTRDPRRVERKKAGHLKARKKPAWVKR